MKGLKGAVKKIVLLALIGGLIYTVLNYHFIFVGKKIRVLKKTSPNMEYIFFSTKSKRINTILNVEPLWEAGIGELLVREGLISKEKLDLYKEKREEEKDH
jgi:hypothetical protein